MRAGCGWIARQILVALVPIAAAAQDLAPRAYLPTPVASNAIILTYAVATGDVLLDPTVPITGASGTVHSPVASYYRAFGLAGRSANITGSMPLAIADFRGKVVGEDRATHRAGIGDAVLRLAVNLKGGPARTAPEFMKGEQPSSLLGASLKVVMPTGQYDPSRLINIGTNRWAFKPELAVVQRLGKVIVEGYAGVWFFTANDEFFAPDPARPAAVRTQDPIGAWEVHVSYDVKPRLWISADVNYWRGGRTSLNGVPGVETLQANSRLGLTGSVPLTRRQALKVSYSEGVVVRLGGDFRIVSAGWQYSWLSQPARR